MGGETTKINHISDRIPNFRGYASREGRAEAEALLRSCVARALADHRARLAELEVDLLARDDARYAEVDRAVVEVQILIDGIRAAEPGEIAWLERHRLRDEDLALLALIDAALLRGADEVGAKTQEACAHARGREMLAPFVGDLVYIVRDMTIKLERRTRIIREPL